jgi:hypothetical protein
MKKKEFMVVTLPQNSEMGDTWLSDPSHFDEFGDAFDALNEMVVNDGSKPYRRTFKRVVMEKGTLQEWIEGFEKELQSRFDNAFLKVYVIDESAFSNSDIVNIICKYAGITRLQLVHKRKGLNHESDARMVVCYFLSTVKKLKPVQIVNRDRTTVLHAINTINDRLKYKDYAVTNLVENVNKILIEQAKILSDEKHV